MTTTESQLDTTELKQRVKRMYEEVALEADNEFHFETGRALAERLGYPAAALDQIPAQAIESFAGVGYFLDLAAIVTGESVMDLGSGSGMDSFLAAALAGHAGRVVGIDMTEAQLAKARRLASEAGFANAAFREGHIERPPVDDATFDCVISNGVVNLSPDKRRVFAEAARVLRPGGRLALADIVTERQISARTACKAELWAACIAGASQIEPYLADVAAAGLEVQLVQPTTGYRFTSERAQRTSEKYGAHSISLLALNPVRASRHYSRPDLGDGADVARATSEEGLSNTTTTQEVAK
jgi:ubiquinone/menaquinone biosynthesis C-methylase UbiE